MRFISILVLISLGGCVGEPRAVPKAPVKPVVMAPQTPPAAPPLAEWIDREISPGDWTYRRDERGSVAMFGAVGSDADFLIRCVATTKRIYLSRRGTFAGGVSGQMTIRASTAAKSYGVANNGDTPPYVSAFLTPADPHLDAIAFSRGRFLVAVKGAADLIIPTWPEFTHVVEDCRA